MLVDGEWARMGSSNCDVRSFRLNYELDLVVEKGEFIEKLHGQFEKEFAESTEIFWSDVANKPAITRLAENSCALFTPIL
jgi:cardiolipin synthase